DDEATRASLLHWKRAVRDNSPCRRSRSCVMRVEPPVRRLAPRDGRTSERHVVVEVLVLLRGGRGLAALGAVAAAGGAAVVAAALLGLAGGRGTVFVAACATSASAFAAVFTAAADELEVLHDHAEAAAGLAALLVLPL